MTSRSLCLVIVVLVASPAGLHAADQSADRWQQLSASRDQYRKALDELRHDYGGSYKLPAVDFFLFGMGGRQKLVYKRGELREATGGKTIRAWDVAEEIISPADYTVALKTKRGEQIFLSEDQEAVWLETDGRREALTRSPVKLPDFQGHKRRLSLRVLHQEILINVVDGKPVPNFFVYPKPWLRDGAMMAMVLEKTGNLSLIKDWIVNLKEPYDKNNAGESEADNLGETLYLLSLAADKSHPLVTVVQRELQRFKKETWIEGRSDFAPRPVYQTKWAKFGLKSLGLDDPLTIPKQKDAYAALFWWDYHDADAPGQPLLAEDAYPYLTWASDHYSGKKRGKVSDRDYPLSWEANASQARYAGMDAISPEYVKAKAAAPHTWHAAEMFLRLWDER